MISNYLLSFGRCAMTRRQGLMLVAHLEGDQRRAICGRDNCTSRSLIERGWLSFDSFAGLTSLTKIGRRAALTARAAFAHEPTPPPLVPDAVVEELV